MWVAIVPNQKNICPLIVDVDISIEMTASWRICADPKDLNISCRPLNYSSQFGVPRLGRIQWAEFDGQSRCCPVDWRKSRIDKAFDKYLK